MLHCFLQIAAASALFWAWTFIIFNTFTGSAVVTYRHYFVYWLLVGCGLVIDTTRSHQDKTDFLNLDFIRNCKISFRQTVTVLVVLLLFLVASKDLAISRVFLFTFVPPLFFLCLYSNRLFPRFLARFIFSGQYLQNTILMGAAEPVMAIRNWLERKRFYGINVVGLVTDDREAQALRCVPISGSRRAECNACGPDGKDGSRCLTVLGSSTDLEGHIRQANATQLIAVGWPSDIHSTNQLADTCQRLGVRLLIAGDFEGALGRKVTLVEDDGVHVMAFYREPLECPFNRIMKRALDLMIAIPAVVFVLPVVSALVWVLHRLQSPGPLFFRQERTGMQDRDFMIYKFRTMHVNNPDEAQQARVNDTRVFAAGRWLRRLSIDEIPQFINVIKGEMSVVGPRPHMRAHDNLFKLATNAYGVRGFIKPGMTGLAQVRDFRGETKTEQDMVDRLQSDLDYLENWSFLLDGLIILRTVWKVLFPPKASY